MPNVRGKENTEKKNDHIPLGKKKKVNRAINTRKKIVVCLYVTLCNITWILFLLLQVFVLYIECAVYNIKLCTPMYI